MGWDWDGTGTGIGEGLRGQMVFVKWRKTRTLGRVSGHNYMCAGGNLYFNDFLLLGLIFLDPDFPYYDGGFFFWFFLNPYDPPRLSHVDDAS